MSGYIDIVANLFTSQDLAAGRTGIGAAFLDTINMADADRGGVSIDRYLSKMDAAGIERSLLVAVRAGDEAYRGSFEIAYEQVAEVCAKYPARFSGLAGIDPSRGMRQLVDLEQAVRDFGFVGAHWYPHRSRLAPDAARIYPVYAKCCELGIPIMLQVGQNMVFDDASRLPSVGRPIALDQVAIDFPDLVIIGMHIGIPWADEMISMAWKHANVFIGADAYPARHWPPTLIHYANTYGREKVLFGSGWPVMDPVDAVRGVEGLGLRTVSMARLMGENARRIFRVD